MFVKNETCILILHRDSPGEIISLIEELKCQSYKDYSLLVIDDNSNVDNVAMLDSISDNKVRVVPFQSPWRYGVAQKWDFGLRIAALLSSEFTLTIQTDMHSLSNDFLINLVECMKADSHLGILSPTIYNSDQHISWGPGIVKSRMGKSYVASECMMFKNEALKRFDYLNANLRHFSEEFYIYNKTKELGYKIDIISEASLVHVGGGTSNRISHNKIRLRARDTILVLKYFNSSNSLYQKIRYYIEENSEFTDQLIDSIKKLKLLRMVTLLFLFFQGFFQGLFTRCNEVK